MKKLKAVGERKIDWIGMFKGKKPEKCPLCGRPILPESYVGIKPDGTIYCKKCVTDEAIKLQAKMLEENSKNCYI